MTASSTRRCRRWRAVAAASLDALDRRQSPGEREVAERRSRKTYTVERRRGRSDAPHLLHLDLDLEAPPPSEPTMGKTPTAPPRRCEGASDGGSKTTLRRAPTPEKRSTVRKHQPPRLHLQNADDLQPKSAYTINRTRDGIPRSPAAEAAGGGRGIQRIEPTRWSSLVDFRNRLLYTVDGEGNVQGRQLWRYRWSEVPARPCC